MSAGHALHIFINGQLSGKTDKTILCMPAICRCFLILNILFNLLAGTVYGSVDDPKLTYTGNVKLWAGSNTISCLSIAVGLPVSRCSASGSNSTLGYMLFDPFQTQLPFSSIIECGRTFWDLECWDSWPSDAWWPEWGKKGSDMAEMDLSGIYHLPFDEVYLIIWRVHEKLLCLYR